MEGIQYYIYILQLANGGYYIGCTKNLDTRLAVHFGSGGAIATKEIKPVSIDRIYTLVDYKIGYMYAHEIAEVFIATRYSDIFGPNFVRGAKHGKGWADSISPNGEKIIKRVRDLANQVEGVKLIERIKRHYFNNNSYWLGKMSKTPTQFDLFVVRPS